MPDGSLDPSRLEGEALRRWYLRSPDEIERERQAWEARRYQEFFNPSGQRDVDPGFAIRTERPWRDVDPDFAITTGRPGREIDPDFSVMPSGMSRWPIDHPLAGAASQDPDHPANYTMMAAARAEDARPAVTTTSAASRPSPPTAPSASSDYLDDLRARRQAEFDQAARDADIHNSWFALPALAPVATVLGLEGAAALAGDAATSQATRAPLNFIEREAWQGKAAVDKIVGRLGDATKAILRREGRARLAQANGTSASEMGAQVHHADPLEFAHLKPNADPNRLANLWALPEEAHQIVSNAWGAFRAGLKGRMPTQAEVMAAKLRIDRLVEPYIVRPGVARPKLPPE